MAQPAYLVLAPHLRWPLRNGADLLVARRWQAFSRLGPAVQVVGETEIVRFAEGREVSRARFSNRMRSRRHAGIRALLTGTHYLAAKFNTPAFAEAVRSCAPEHYDAIVLSMLSTWDALPASSRAKPLVVETHNYDFGWFEDRRDEAKNPLARRVAQRSLERTAHYLEALPPSAVLLAVTESDRDAYRRHVAHPERVIYAPVGVDLPASDSLSSLPPSSAPLLLFVGALSVDINAAALEFFADRYARTLRRSDVGARVVVAGSSPSERVQRLIAREHWTLHTDVSEAQLDALYAESTAAILPFEKAQGAKLKLYRALSRGVPVLTTPAVSVPRLPPTCLVSGDPEAWADHVATLAARGLSCADRKELWDAAAPHSWERIAAGLYRDLAPMLRPEHSDQDIHA